MAIYEFLWLALIEITKSGLWPVIDPVVLP